MTNGTTPAEPKVGLRELTRASVRDQIAEQALLLFDEKGFDATTVDDIAAAVGISARSFFRYFPTKEDAVIRDPSALAGVIRDAAAARPADESAWVALRRALDPFDVTDRADITRALRHMRVMMSTASLRARNVEKHIVWAVTLEPVIIERLGAEHVRRDGATGDADTDGDADAIRFEAQTLIHAALACFDVALSEWTRREGITPIHTLIDEAFGTLQR
jgi:AcrR family transcriptional regulator